MVNKLTSKRKKIIVIAAMCIVMAIGGIMAYFTADDTATNTFTMGKITIKLTEPNWMEANNQLITPNMESLKDPQITNTGKNDAFVFIRVEIPKEQVTTANVMTGTIEQSEVTQLFQTNKTAKSSAARAWTGTDTINANWKLIKTDKTTSSAVNIYVYAYASTISGVDVCTKLKPEKTTPAVFESVTAANICENNGKAVGKDDKTLTEQKLNIKVDAYAIQADNIANEEDGAEEYQTAARFVWNILANQQSLSPKAKTN